jgi:hypothetical protein
MSTQPIPEPQRRKGFTPFPNDVLLDWPRLVSGNAQIFTLMFLNSETTGAVRARGTEPPYWSRPISTEELSAFGRCTARAVQLALDDLAARKVIERKKSLHGMCRYHIPFDTWAGLPDRPSNVLPISGDSEEPEEDTEEGGNLAGQVLPVFSKPQRLRGGARPRPKELPVAVGKLRVTSDAEIEYSGSICDGVLFLEFKVPKGESKANQERSNHTEDATKSKKTQTGLIRDALFNKFLSTCRKCGLSFSPTDIEKTYRQWSKLPDADKPASIQGLLDRLAAGEFSDPMYRPLPQNYLKNGTWHRAVRRPVSRAESKMEERRRNVAHAMELAEEIDRKAGRS